MSGSAEYIGGGLILNITGGLEWPVNGWAIPDTGNPIGTHWAADVADCDTDPALSSNIEPNPPASCHLSKTLAGVALARIQRNSSLPTPPSEVERHVHSVGEEHRHSHPENQDHPTEAA